MSKERWYWVCDYSNHASCFADRGWCRARSNKTFSTEEKATEALERHIKKSRHPYYMDLYGEVKGYAHNSRRCGHVRQLKKYERYRK